MARGRLEEAGKLIAWLISNIRPAVWGSGEMDPAELNLYKPPPPVSEAMKAYIAGEHARRLRKMGEE